MIEFVNMLHREIRVAGVRLPRVSGAHGAPHVRHMRGTPWIDRETGVRVVRYTSPVVMGLPPAKPGVAIVVPAVVANVAAFTLPHRDDLWMPIGVQDNGDTVMLAQVSM